jgi:DMSO/TMAO reductase YedYZ molybdopterin-dependent catalytic subunit
MSRVEILAVLQCAGNGRGYFPDRPPGAPWEVGAAGLGFAAMFFSAKLRRGLAAPYGYFLSRNVLAYDHRIGEDRAESRVERSILISKAMRDVLLTFELNGQPLPVAHGGPVRLIVPGYFAINSIKYPSRVAVTAEESSAPIMATDYRLFSVDAEAGDLSQPTCWAMNAKSWITTPLGDRKLSLGLTTIMGLALAGENAIQRVEVMTGGGASWNDAALVGPDLGPPPDGNSPSSLMPPRAVIR